MPGGRATPIFQHYLQKWSTCRDAKDKMFFIVTDMILELAYGSK